MFWAQEEFWGDIRDGATKCVEFIAGKLSARSKVHSLMFTGASKGTFSGVRSLWLILL